MSLDNLIGISLEKIEPDASSIINWFLPLKGIYLMLVSLR